MTAALMKLLDDILWESSEISHISIHENTLNTLKPEIIECYFPEDIFKCIFLNDNEQFAIKISLKFVPKGPINNIPALA